MNKRWRLVPCSNTEINRKGEVRNALTKNLHKQSLSDTGYFVFGSKINGKWKTLTTHRWVAILFIPNPENKRCVNHKDLSKINNNASNLEWVSYRENVIHAHKNGAVPIKYGNKNHNSKLRDEDISTILSMRKSGMTMVQIAKLYQVKRSCIKNIFNGSNWSHVSGVKKRVYKRLQ